MQKLYIPPTDIEVSVVLNNRDMDQNYVADLTQSMQEKGFLPEYPIEVVPAANIPNIETQLPYICACGAHRTKAAINAKLETVLVHVYDERDEAFIERMHLDNFKFDPAIDSSIGQPFTNKEKRAACTQLLMLPKFFEMTNAALHEAWRIPETNIRRWREEVVKLLETNSPKLRHWAISDGRIARLHELAASTERVDGDGKIVKIRQKVVDASDEEKKAFWSVIEDDSIRVGIDWDHVQLHVREKFETESRWRIYEDVTMKNLQALHQLILSRDKTFLEAVRNSVAKEAENKMKAEALEKAIDQVNRVFRKAYAPREDKWSQEYRGMRKRFTQFIQGRGEKFKQFFMDRYDYDSDFRSSPESAEVAKLHDEIAEDIKSEAEWLKDFMAAEEQALAKHRQKAESDWLKYRQAVLMALADYPRDVEDRILMYQCDENILYEHLGTLEKLLATEAPSDKKFTKTIMAEADWFKKSANAIAKDIKWIAEIPEKKSMMESLIEAETDEEPLVYDEVLNSILKDRLTPLTNDEVLNALPLSDIFENITTRMIEPEDEFANACFADGREKVKKLIDSFTMTTHSRVGVLAIVAAELLNMYDGGTPNGEE